MAEHFLVDAHGTMGMIDFGDAAVGDPAIDFAGLLKPLGDKRIRALLGEYGQPEWWPRVRAYHRIAPIHAILHGRATGNGRMVANARRRIAAELRARVRV
ncbi:MAG: phosphotransferase [Sciscionella sp.]|nr:phosphotransferase [Sciscionella sp.]